MTDTTPPPIVLSTAELNSLLRKIIKERWPTWKHYTIKKDAHSNHMTTLVWKDHLTRPQMEAFLPKCSHGSYFSREPTVFTYKDQVYHSQIRLDCYRQYSEPFLLRVATLFCRIHQVPLPQTYTTEQSGTIIRSEKNEPEIEGKPLSKAIMEYVRTVSEEDLPQLEQECDAQYPPLPAPGEELQQQREERQRIQHLKNCLAIERKRQSYQYAEHIYLRIESRHADFTRYVQMQKEIEQAIAAFAPSLEHPVVCSNCAHVWEQAQCTQSIHPHFHYTQSICPDCIAKGHTATFEPNLDVEEEERILTHLEAHDEDTYTPVYDEEKGIYLAKNGDHMPVLTRDLLNDVRESKWWLYFGPERSIYRPGRRTVIHALEDDVWEALKAEGWQYGHRRKQYYHPNKYGVLHIPAIVYERYGGYIDGGYCDYRSGRGERLRAYADKVTEQAEDMAAWSEQIVSQYMATGSIVTGGRRTRKLQREKARAERKAQQAKELDAYARDLYRRANSSEYHQYRVSSTPMLHSRLETIATESRLLEKHFTDAIESMARHIEYRSTSTTMHSVRWFVDHYHEYILPRKEILQDEYDLISETIEARAQGEKQAPTQPEPVAVPEPVERSFSVEQVIEVNVGDNRTDLFPTHPDIADRILEAFPIPDTAQFVLEPNGGTGSYLARIKHHLDGVKVQIHTYEWLYDLNKHLIAQGYQVMGTDFLEAELNETLKAHGGYDDICMNPPFNAWEKHLLHAWKLGRPGCRIRCTVPRGGIERSRTVQLMQGYATEYQVLDLPEDAFKQSNTNVQTSVLYLVKPVPVEKPVVPVQPVVVVEEKRRPAFTEYAFPSTKTKRKESKGEEGIKQESLF